MKNPGRIDAFFNDHKWLMVLVPAIVLIVVFLLLLLFASGRQQAENLQINSSSSPDRVLSSSTIASSSENSSSQTESLWEPETIILSTKEISLQIQESYQLSYTVAPENSVVLPATFRSSDSSIAQVSEDGKVTAISTGEADITVTLQNGISTTVHITVRKQTVPVTSLTLNLSSVTLQVGQSRQPLVTMLPQNASDKTERWISSNQSIATVDSSGTIRAVRVGECNITVSSVSNPQLSASVKVTVVPASSSSSSSTSSSANSSSSTSEPNGTFASWNQSCNWNMMVINKDNKIPDHYSPQITSYESIQIDQRVLPHLKAMMEAARADNAGLYLASGYRDIALQTKLYERKVKYYLNKGYSEKDARIKAATVVAKPGTSEHNTGLSVDFNNVENDFCETKGYRWLTEHAADYGFIMRYPTNKQSITNVIYEPWHFRYVGVENAKAIKASGLCLEEYVSTLLS